MAQLKPKPIAGIDSNFCVLCRSPKFFGGERRIKLGNAARPERIQRGEQHMAAMYRKTYDAAEAA
jgi:hypothetical protein